MRKLNLFTATTFTVLVGISTACSGDKKPSGDGDGDGGGNGASSGDGDASTGTGGTGTGGLGAGAGTGTGAAAGTGGDAAAAGGAPYVPMECADQTPPTFSVERLDSTAVAQLGTPFNPDQQDTAGPDDWATNYGKTPEIVPFASGGGLDVLFQDQDSGEFAYVVHIIPAGESWEIDTAFRVQSLGRIMGLAKDEAGNYFVATGVDEDDVVDETYPPNEIHRSNIVRVVKFDIHGCVLMESDVDIERGNADSGSEIIVNPMVAASSRLVYGGDRLLLVHGHNTEPDANIGGTRHQKAIATHINALDGTATRTSTMWVSHSFDQRALYDGSGFVELHLGDAYPRYVTLGRYNDGGGDGGYSAYTIKGAEGANNTHTRLGSLIQTADPTYGYMALFATERQDGVDGQISGTRDVALVRIESNFMDQDNDESIVEEGGTATAQMVTSKGQSVTNYVHWLTDLGSGNHAERPRMTMTAAGEYVVLYERWINDGDDFDGVYALRVDESGSVVAGPTEVPGDHHISRGDDIVTLGGRAVYVTGGEGALYLNFVGSDLSAERVTLP